MVVRWWCGGGVTTYKPRGEQLGGEWQHQRQGEQPGRRDGKADAQKVTTGCAPGGEYLGCWRGAEPDLLMSVLLRPDFEGPTETATGLWGDKCSSLLTTPAEALHSIKHPLACHQQECSLWLQVDGATTALQCWMWLPAMTLAEQAYSTFDLPATTSSLL